MERTALKNRKLPDYTKGEEIFNMVSHIVGGALGVAALTLCVVFSFIEWDAYKIAGSFIYGFSVVLLYTMSSLYHGITPKKDIAKKVFQVIDHCMIFILIAGTYTPITISAMREVNAPLAWVVFGFVWGASALGITLNAIDIKSYKKFSMICYLVIGWCAIFTLKWLIEAITLTGFLFILLGGVSYSIGAMLYSLGHKKGLKYMHSVFHIFVVFGTVLHFFGIFFYVVMR
ncbi:MAG: hemolysin III family protein [Ruminococcaceae bacterium]|nr:hemolysin III family protein [Oscillospiraceae bacterium]